MGATLSCLSSVAFVSCTSPLALLFLIQSYCTKNFSSGLLCNFHNWHLTTSVFVVPEFYNNRPWMALFSVDDLTICVGNKSLLRIKSW